MWGGGGHGPPKSKNGSVPSLQPLMLIRYKTNSYCNIQTKPPIHSKVKILVKNTNKEIQTDLDLVQCVITQIHLPNNSIKTMLVCNFHIYIYINKRYFTSKAIPIWISYFKNCCFGVNFKK